MPHPLLTKIFCLHQWVEWKEISVTDLQGNRKYRIFHLKCTVCGKLKKVKSR